MSEVYSINSESKSESLMAYYMHQNGLMWNRIQTAVAVQGAIFFAALQANNFLSGIVLLLGAFFTFSIYTFMTRDREIRNRIEEELKLYGFNLNTDFKNWAKSKYLTTPLFWGFIIVDLIAGIVQLLFWFGFEIALVSIR